MRGSVLWKPGYPHERCGSGSTSPHLPAITGPLHVDNLGVRVGGASPGFFLSGDPEGFRETGSEPLCGSNPVAILDSVTTTEVVRVRHALWRPPSGRARVSIEEGLAAAETLCAPQGEPMSQMQAPSTVASNVTRTRTSWGSALLERGEPGQPTIETLERRPPQASPWWRGGGGESAGGERASQAMAASWVVTPGRTKPRRGSAACAP
jgi:hypothetical protein